MRSFRVLFSHSVHLPLSLSLSLLFHPILRRRRRRAAKLTMNEYSWIAYVAFSRPTSVRTRCDGTFRLERRHIECRKLFGKLFGCWRAASASAVACAQPRHHPERERHDMRYRRMCWTLTPHTPPSHTLTEHRECSVKCAGVWPLLGVPAPLSPAAPQKLTKNKKSVTKKLSPFSTKLNLIKIPLNWNDELSSLYLFRSNCHLSMYVCIVCVRRNASSWRSTLSIVFARRADNEPARPWLTKMNKNENYVFYCREIYDMKTDCCRSTFRKDQRRIGISNGS